MKKKTKIPWAVCGECGKPIDLAEINAALRARMPYAHGCGRRLLKGSGNAEVPIANHDDLSLSDTSESESAGD